MSCSDILPRAVTELVDIGQYGHSYHAIGDQIARHQHRKPTDGGHSSRIADHAQTSITSRASAKF